MPTPNIDIRLKRLSHSSRTALHRCPRKYQLQKIAKQEYVQSENVTLAYGTVVGLGIQCILEGKTLQATVLEMFLAWPLADIYAEETKNNKSFWTAIFAVQQFTTLRAGAFADYELAFFHDKPAVELSFRVSILNGFTYRGYVDVVLRNKRTGKFLVLEVKTTGAKSVNEAQYKNSGQALGYSLILDSIAPGQSEYEVWYLVYMSSAQQYEILPFKKHYSDRAFWIKELVMDVHRIEYYEDEGRYPAYGESCFDFFRECEFLGNCQMSIDMLSLPYDAETDRELTEEYLLELTLVDLIDAQLNRQEIVR